MNRQIKFRAWDGKKMDFNVERNGQFGFYLHNFKCTQFTGEKDVNGTEIWEGDIVKRMADKYDFDKPDGKDHWEEVEISQIEYRGNGFWVKDECFGWEGENLWDWKQMEVIGNIFETPELLKSDGKK